MVISASAVPMYDLRSSKEAGIGAPAALASMTGWKSLSYSFLSRAKPSDELNLALPHSDRTSAAVSAWSSFLTDSWTSIVW